MNNDPRFAPSSFPHLLALVAAIACCSASRFGRAAEGLPAAEPFDAKVAFAKLKSLAGEWSGSMGQPEGPPAKVVWRVTANGHTVMETLLPGSHHEMVSMYHLDGTNLVMTHYCAAGNQPQMKLDLPKSSPKELVFAFTGGTNLDPDKDGHIHSGIIRLLSPDKLEADWAFYQGREAKEKNQFYFSRVAGPGSAAKRTTEAKPKPTTQ